jgi:hypothetical protein
MFSGVLIKEARNRKVRKMRARKMTLKTAGERASAFSSLREGIGNLYS